MTTPNTTEYLIHEFPEPPPPRPWWMSLVRIAATVAVLIVVGVVGYDIAERLGERAGVESTVDTVVAGVEVEFVIPPGATARQVSTLLEQQGIVADAGQFEDAVAEAGAAARLRAGSYTVMTGSAAGELIALFVAGPPEADSYRVTVIEGLRIEDMLQALADQSPHEYEDFEAALVDNEVTSPLVPAPDAIDDPLARWEGLLAPDTYEFIVDATPQQILQRLANTLTQRVEAQDWSAIEALGLTPYDGLILASLVEKEAKLEDERPLISSVIYNRLAIGQALQIDATIIYALNNDAREVLLEDLEIDSPYNTYLNQGLPPTPIGGVRTSSLVAAAQPADTEYFYYVLVDRDGTHGFSETLEEHNAKKAQAEADGVITP
jgi:UPF0755 protein